MNASQLFSFHDIKIFETELTFFSIHVWIHSIIKLLVKERATKSLQAHWKTVAPDLDYTPTWSVSQEKLAYTPPAVRNS